MFTQGLFLGLGSPPKTGEESKTGQPPMSNRFDFDPCLTLALPGETFYSRTANDKAIDRNISSFYDQSGGCGGEDSYGAASSFSSGKAVKREREASSGNDTETSRKKLRLTKDQSALLEESFNQHVTLNPKQKQALARRLNLRPRQVEVWFQNRRARTKLKQTEVDCEFLKKCWETLSDENRRLQKEVQDLKELRLAQPLYMHATLAKCVCPHDKLGPFSTAQTTNPSAE